MDVLDPIFTPAETRKLERVWAQIELTLPEDLDQIAWIHRRFGTKLRRWLSEERNEATVSYLRPVEVAEMA
jgi:hypothetical protein